MNKVKTIFHWLVAIACFLMARTALAIETGLDATASATGLKKGDIPGLVGIIIKALLGLVGIIFFGLLLYGGFIWMKARGNEKEVEKAKGVITDAIIGIVIVAAAYAISSFIIQTLS